MTGHSQKAQNNRAKTDINKVCRRTFLLTALLIVFLATPVWAGSEMKIVVKTILAKHGQKYVDPRINKLVRELQTIFGYSSYKLESANMLKLGFSKQGTVKLPGNRLLRIVPIKVVEKRLELKLMIFKVMNKKQKLIFQTVTRLRNNSSVTVGGPKHAGGVLLFNIFSSF